ncbi:hypothetical protein [Parvibaculum sp.]|uniref:hypothetical protein n=1 Tax=Parvibaculum sp. TaxID=2024848 RepID=UPI0025E3B9E8|nr:hypothetical protein [Parvibaculum sp.]
MKADVNVIDLDRLRILAPEMVFDLPAEGRRMIQRAEGYRATVVNGVVTFETARRRVRCRAGSFAAPSVHRRQSRPPSRH